MNPWHRETVAYVNLPPPQQRPGLRPTGVGELNCYTGAARLALVARASLQTMPVEMVKPNKSLASDWIGRWAELEMRRANREGR